MRPDAAIFHEHIQSAEFQAGVDRGDWGVHQENPEYPEWPIVVLWISALEKPGKPNRYYFRFDLNAYPQVAPTACPWNIATGARLDNGLWPRGSALVSFTFNFGWNATALYAPCDRVAMVGHDLWRTQFPDLWWQPSFQITVYLKFIHGLLHSSDYARS